MKNQKAFSYLTNDQRAHSHEQIVGKYKEHAGRELDHPKLQTLLKNLSGPVLDLGSGNGRIFTVLHTLGVTDTHGADIADYLSVGRPSGSFKNFDFSADRFLYDDATFGAITSIEVIEHLENPYHFLREAARILKPGGTLLITTPNPDHLYNRLFFLQRGRFYRFNDTNDHISLFSRHVLVKGALPYLDLVRTEYLFGEFPYHFLFNKLSYPENKLFGRSAVYILRKKVTGEQ